MTIPELEKWSNWANIAVATLGVLAAIAAVVAMYFSARLSSEKDAAFDSFKAASEATIATANARAAEANKKAAEAGEGTAKALATAATAGERAAALEVQAAALRERLQLGERATERIQNHISPRHITSAQRDTLIATLKALNATGQITLQTPINDAESLVFATEIKAALSSAGLSTDGVIFAAFEINPIGLYIVIRDAAHVPPLANAIRNAFEKIGVAPSGDVDPSLSPSSVVLVVGVKPKS